MCSKYDDSLTRSALSARVATENNSRKMINQKKRRNSNANKNTDLSKRVRKTSSSTKKEKEHPHGCTVTRDLDEHKNVKRVKFESDLDKKVQKEEGPVPKKIIGVRMNEKGEREMLIQWSQPCRKEWLSAKELNAKFPYHVIDYYESILTSYVPTRS